MSTQPPATKPVHRTFLGLSIVGAILLLSARYQLVNCFHLSFGQRLLRSSTNPQLNPASTLIRPIECRNVNNQSEAGICMFSIDCMQNKGVPLSVCKHNYFVGTCCRLPDYNNFVGIVYDLRDTETNQILEARRVGPQTSLAGPSTSEAAPAGMQQLLPSREKQPLELASSPAEALAPAGAAPSSGQKSPLKLEPEQLRPEDRYMISATSLFPSAASIRPPQLLPDQQLGVKSAPTRLVSPLESPPGPANSGETARNADGQVMPLTALGAATRLSEISRQPMVVASELDSFHIQSSPSINYSAAAATEPMLSSELKIAAVSAAPSQQHVYELVKDDNLEVLSTINSAHSAPSGQPTAMTESAPQKQQLDRQSTSTSTSSSPQVSSSVHLQTEASSKSPEMTSSTQATIVLANNHQQPAAPPVATLAADSSANSSTDQPRSSVYTAQSGPSDQEFTLSSGQPSSTSTTTGANQDSSPSRTQSSSASGPPSDQISSGTASVDVTGSSGWKSPETSGQQPTTLAFSAAPSSSVSATSSPLVDLVSSHSATTLQTTTPFTTSLSTALLPNVSSHPWAPTASPALVSLASPPPAPSSSSAPFSTTRLSPQSGPSTQTLVSSSHQPTGEPPLSGFSQLYSNQHSSSAPASASEDHYAASLPHYHHQARPSLNGPALMAASKIVAGGSNSNNLIPGLSGLQSAILSHIPFKLASGLSSGLSSYLQAAMKPSGNRPLLSSNTAPSLQYQQQMLANATKSPSSSQSIVLQAASSGAQSGAIRFPGSTSSSVTASTESPSASQANWITQTLANASSPAPQSMGSSTLSPKDVAREAKLVAAGLSVKAPDLLLRLGEFDVSNQEEIYPYVERRVKTVVSHPSFDPKTFEYDLALLRFTEPIKFERNIIPVCVPSGNDSYVDRMATVIGWGRLYEDGPLPDIIQHVDVPIITNNECEKMYKNAGYIEEIPDMFICAGINKGGRDSCEGDSGGPLTMVDNDGRSYLVGIISWGIGCALPSQPGVYTRITAFSGWINQIIDY